MIKIYKQILKDFSKLNIILLSIMCFITSFMYFFVESTIDKNMNYLNTLSSLSKAQNDLMTALTSNKSLADTFLIALLLITAFVFNMFFKRFFITHKPQLGCFKQLGYTGRSISFVFVNISFILSLICSVIGLIAGFFASYVLLNNYTVSFNLDVSRGLNISSILIGTVLISVILSAVTYLCTYNFRNEETAFLISNYSNKKPLKFIIKISNKLSKYIPSSYSFSTRLALRKPFTIILTMLSVGIFLILFFISTSLNMTSKVVYDSQLNSRTYKYSFALKNYQKDDADTNAAYYLKSEMTLNTSKKDTVKQTIIGMSDNTSLYVLKDKKENTLNVPDNNTVIINPMLSDVYNIKINDVINIGINDKTYPFTVSSVADNADSNTVYISKDNLADLLNINKDMHNYVLSTKDLNIKDADKVSNDMRLDALNKNNVSSKSSAVIDQILACILGSLLIFLALLLNFQDNTDNFIILKTLGYLPKQINSMLVNIYRPIVNLSFLITLIPSIYICKAFQSSLSKTTGDYMPFRTNIFIIFLSIVIINILYIVVQLYFRHALNKTYKRITN